MTCANPVRHVPRVDLTESHHHPPTAWRRELLKDPDVDQSWWRVARLCPNCHNGQYHGLLDSYVRAKGVPPWSVRRSYSVHIRNLVTEAWEHRPAGRLPYTLT